MFKQLKSALCWYYLYKFRRRFLLIFSLLLIALISNFIYSDIVEILKIKEKTQYLEIALLIKWFIILFSIILSFYLILTLFKKDQEDSKNDLENSIKDDKFTNKEKEFLHKKTLRTKADFLINKD